MDHCTLSVDISKAGSLKPVFCSPDKFSARRLTSHLQACPVINGIPLARIVFVFSCFSMGPPLLFGAAEKDT